MKARHEFTTEEEYKFYLRTIYTLESINNFNLPHNNTTVEETIAKSALKIADYILKGLFASPVVKTEANTTAVNNTSITDVQIEAMTRLLKESKEEGLHTDAELKAYWKGFQGLSYSDATIRMDSLYNQMHSRRNDKIISKTVEVFENEKSI